MASNGEPSRSGSGDVTRAVPRGLRIGAALAWRFLAVAGALYVVLWLIGYFSVVLIPVAIALLLAALMAPAVLKLARVGVPRGLATVLVLVLGLAALGGVMTFVVDQFTSGLPALRQQLGESLHRIQAWLVNGPFHLRQEQIQNAVTQAIGRLQGGGGTGSITTGALTTASTLGEILTGAVLTLFVLIFFLTGGETVWKFLMRGVPAAVRTRVDVAGRRGFASLVSYIRATALVAVVDAVGIGVGIAIVGVPLVFPLATLVFLGAFVPVVGAVVTGGVAVLVALVTHGLIGALIVLGIVTLVMQLEGHVLQPLLLGRAVRLHPLAVVLSISAGLVAAGVPGALLAVPLLAVLNAGIRSLRHERDPEPGKVDVLRDQAAKPDE